MYFLNKDRQKGFIVLFFIISVSISLLTIISLGTERVFDYVYIKTDFYKNRQYLYEKLICADLFINLFIKSDYNIDIIDNKYNFYRNIHISDEYICYIENIDIKYIDNSLNSVFFISGGFGFKYIYKNGFVKYIKSFKLF